MRRGRLILAVVAGLWAGPLTAGTPAARLLAPIPADETRPAVETASARIDPPARVSAPRPPEPADRDSFAFGDKLKDLWGKATDRRGLQGDHAFDALISPVSNPLLFEDPRSTTEVRPLFLYQKVPATQPNFGGGTVWFAGGQVRVALSERFSVVLNKIGVVNVKPAAGTGFDSGTGLAELWVGPKYTFLRDEEFGTVAAAGATFQIPAGGAKVFQDTGSLSVVPYLSLAQPLTKTRLGTLNGLANAGYAFSVNKDRSDYFSANAHLDLDVLNARRFYPLAELTYTQVTSNGRERPGISGEGRDLINFGGTGKGGSLTGAVGGRVKLTKSLDVGAAFELPLAGNKDFLGHRFTVDLIWRY